MTTQDNEPLTRREFQAFRDEMRQDSRSFREDMYRELQHYATKADLAEMKAELIKWMVGLMVASIAAATTFAFAVERLVGN